MATSLGDARAARVDPQPNAVRAGTARWQEAASEPAKRRSFDAVIAEVSIEKRTRPGATLKRCIDVVGSASGLVALSPVFVVLGVLVRLTSKGPAIFVQERCGIGGRRFNFYKFRTMIEDAESRMGELAHLNEMNGPVFKIKRDPRVTRLGAFLRKSSLDELPQLWNVLRGDMSLVGPRPPLPSEVEHYTPRQAQRLGVPPGITGLWQVSGRSDLVEFDRWVELDLEYVRKWSVWLDLKILAKTLVVVIRARGAQ